MFAFQITKWFWNLWDHLLAIILWNLLFLLVLAGFFYLSQAIFTLASIWLLPLAFVFLYLATVMQHAHALSCYAIAKFERSDWKDSLNRVWQKRSLLAALIFDLLLLAVSGIFTLSWRFYSQQGGFLSLLAMGLLFWLTLFLLLSFGFYFPMLVREDFAFCRAVRQSVVICLDNLGLSLGLATVACLLLGLSFLPPLMLFFGPLGLSLWYEVSLRILYYKYQYLEQLAKEPQERLTAAAPRGRKSRRKPEIPWRVLLREEREHIGPRSLRNFIFPWKD